MKRCWDGVNLDSANHQGKIDDLHLNTWKGKWGDGDPRDTPDAYHAVLLDHVAYPTAGPVNFIGQPTACPSTHPVHIPQLMLEVVWDTTQFNDQSLWPTDGSQPFYFSFGDKTGYGQHADYVFGWQNDSLQRAMDVSGCMGATCSQAKLLTQDISTAKQCAVNKQVHEDEDGCEFRCSRPSWCPGGTAMALLTS